MAEFVKYKDSIWEHFLTNILSSNRNMAICYVYDTSLRRNARLVMHWLLANAYVFLVLTEATFRCRNMTNVTESRKTC